MAKHRCPEVMVPSLWVLQRLRFLRCRPLPTQMYGILAFSASPEQAINYVSVHDNLCLYDKVTLWQSANGRTGQSITNSLIAYAFGMILTPQGIPFIYEGDEFQRTKNDNSNSYTTEYDLVWSNLNSTSDAAPMRM